MIHDWDDRTSICARCGAHREHVEDDLVSAVCAAKVQPAADFYDKRRSYCPHCAVGQDHPPGSACASINVVRESAVKVADHGAAGETWLVRESASPADLRAKVNGPWSVYVVGVDPATQPDTTAIALAFGRKHVSDAAWAKVCHAYRNADRKNLERDNARVGVVLLSADEYDALTANKAGSENVNYPAALREQADRTAYWRDLAHKKAGAISQLESKLMTANAELIKRGDSASRRTAFAAIDAENARLRRELAAAKEQRDAALVERDKWHDKASTLYRAANPGVVHVEPFPDPEPRADSWPPPSHKPRMLP